MLRLCVRIGWTHLIRIIWKWYSAKCYLPWPFPEIFFSVFEMHFITKAERDDFSRLLNNCFFSEVLKMNVSERMIITLWREWSLIECQFRVSLIGWETLYKLLIIVDEKVRSSLFKVNGQNLHYFIVENKSNRTLFPPKFSETEHFLLRPLGNEIYVRIYFVIASVINLKWRRNRPSNMWPTTKILAKSVYKLLVTALSIIGCVLLLWKATKQSNYPWHFFKTANWFES